MRIEEIMSETEIADNVTHKLLSRLLNWIMTFVIGFFAFSVGTAFYAGLYGGQIIEGMMAMKASITKIEGKIDQGILGEADVRVESLERWRDRHEAEHR